MAPSPSHTHNIRWTEPLIIPAAAMNSPSHSEASSASNSRPASPTTAAEQPLSSSLPAQRPRMHRPHHHGPHMRRHHSQSPNAPSKPPLLSASIPLPKSHIRRTPSELQLADDVRRAEYDDVRMYARLVVGMQGQMQRGCQPGGAVHPLSRKSLAGVVRTKQAGDAELTKREEDEAAVDASERSEVHDDGDSAPWSTLAQQPPWAKDSNDSLSTQGSMKGGGEEGEHGCVFSLEL